MIDCHVSLAEQLSGKRRSNYLEMGDLYFRRFSWKRYVLHGAKNGNDLVRRGEYQSHHGNRVGNCNGNDVGIVLPFEGNRASFRYGKKRLALSAFLRIDERRYKCLRHLSQRTLAGIGDVPCDLCGKFDYGVFVFETDFEREIFQKSVRWIFCRCDFGCDFEPLSLKKLKNKSF